MLDEILIDITEPIFAVFLLVVVEANEACQALVAFECSNFIVEELNLFSDILADGLRLFAFIED